MGLFLHHVESFLPGDLYTHLFIFYGICCHLVVNSGTVSAKYKYLTSVSSLRPTDCDGEIADLPFKTQNYFIVSV